MKVFLISYDLKKPVQNYTGLYKILQDSLKWWHYLESTWLLAANDNETPKSIYEKFEKLLDKENDYVLIIEVKRNYWGWLPKEAWDWISENINS